MQDEIINELKKNDVKYIILDEENQIDSFGATNLMEYIKNHYKPVKVIGYYTVYKLVE